MSAATCPACHLALPTGMATVRFCPSCGYSFSTGQQPVGWVRGNVDLRKLARYQRMTIWFVLVLLCLQFAPMVMRGLPAIEQLGLIALLLGLQIAIVVGVLQLLTAMGTSVVLRVLCGVLMFAPCANLIVLLVVNGRATSMLQMAGVKVGFMGASDEQVVRLLGANVCHQCGYNLIGNTSGACPECGTPVRGISVKADQAPPVPPGV